jgi:CRP/FNR family transcriptional regulator
MDDDLGAIGYFRGLDAADRRWLAAHSTVRRYAARESVIREGEPCAGLYALRDGQARIFTTSRAGRQQVLAVLQPGDTFNEVPVFDGGPNPASVETLQPSTIVAVPRDAALALISRSPQAALTLLAAFAARLRGFTALVEALAFDDVNRRLARLLARLARAEGRAESDGVVVARTLTVQDIAAMVGSVREVVTRSLTQLEGQGLLAVRPDAFVVPDVAALERLAES